jgi:7-keto-8-aminopelargonate synthetase-like enzyme
MKTSTINLINEVISSSAKKGIIQLITEDEYYDGKTITIDNKKLINFGSCSYLGLELDERLKKSAIDAIERFGIQFSSSRTYVACTLYRELEELVRKIYNAPVVMSTSTSLGHHGVLPVIVEETDAIIMDQQVHASVQDAALKLKAKGVDVTIIRHNDLSELKKKLKNFLKPILRFGI